MSVSTMLSLALAAVVVHGNPLPDSPSRVVKRDPPAPSAYPLGDACTNEWQYLNFDPTNDAARLQQLHTALCSGEFQAVSSFAQDAATNQNKVFLRWFPMDDGDDDDTSENIASALGLVAGTSSGTIGSLVGTFVVDNLDFAVNIEEEDDCTNPRTEAYTLTDPLDNREKIHFCDIAYGYPAAGTQDCSTLDPYPSDKINAFGRVILHEMMHYSSVGPPSGLGQIVDQLNEDDEAAYGPERCHGLLDPDQDDQPGKPENNADSYAWMGVDAYMSNLCAMGQNYPDYFTQDPPPYDEDSGE